MMSTLPTTFAASSLACKKTWINSASLRMRTGTRDEMVFRGISVAQLKLCLHCVSSEFICIRKGAALTCLTNMYCALFPLIRIIIG